MTETKRASAAGFIEAFSPLNRERQFGFVSPSWPILENILPELKTVLPHADFVIEGYVDPTELLRDEGLLEQEDRTDSHNRQ